VKGAVFVAQNPTYCGVKLGRIIVLIIGRYTNLPLEQHNELAPHAVRDFFILIDNVCGADLPRCSFGKDIKNHVLIP
jgi:hypothetical protein